MAMRSEVEWMKDLPDLIRTKVVAKWGLEAYPLMDALSIPWWVALKSWTTRSDFLSAMDHKVQYSDCTSDECRDYHIDLAVSEAADRYVVDAKARLQPTLNVIGSNGISTYDPNTPDYTAWQNALLRQGFPGATGVTGGYERWAKFANGGWSNLSGYDGTDGQWFYITTGDELFGGIAQAFLCPTNEAATADLTAASTTLELAAVDCVDKLYIVQPKAFKARKVSSNTQMPKGIAVLMPQSAVTSAKAELAKRTKDMFSMGGNGSSITTRPNEPAPPVPPPGDDKRGTLDKPPVTADEGMGAGAVILITLASLAAIGGVGYLLFSGRKHNPVSRHNVYYETSKGFAFHPKCFMNATAAIDDRDLWGTLERTRTSWPRGAKCKLCGGKTSKPLKWYPRAGKYGEYR